MVLVPKRDTCNTLSIYCKVNAITKKDVYPLPRIDDILDTLGKSHYFTTLDLASRLWQIEMDPTTRGKSAITTHRVSHEFCSNAIWHVQCTCYFPEVMPVVLAGIEWKFCFVYLDDILVCSSTFEEHLEHLNIVFERLRKGLFDFKTSKV